MLDTDKQIIFMYRFNEDDDNLEEGLVGMLEHTQGRKLASISDVVKEDKLCEQEEDCWGFTVSGEVRLIVVKEGIFEYHDGSYLRVWG